MTVSRRQTAAESADTADSQKGRQCLPRKAFCIMQGVWTQSQQQSRGMDGQRVSSAPANKPTLSETRSVGE